MTNVYRKRRFYVVVALAVCIFASSIYAEVEKANHSTKTPPPSQSSAKAATALDSLDVKGRAPKTGYSRDMFGDGWQKYGECDTRNDILARDLKETNIKNCKVYSGILDDPYTAKSIHFMRGPETSDDVQIDHVVALSDAWQKGAQQLDQETRENLANDPLELLAVDGKANQDKSDGDAATWLPPNKSYRCRYVARQIAVKQKYGLWVTAAEKVAMQRVLSGCPGQVLPIQQ